MGVRDLQVLKEYQVDFGQAPDNRHEVLRGNGNAYSSEIAGTITPRHFPILDIDFPADLFPSTTDGNFHLYLWKSMPWEDLVKLLRVMGEIGLLQQGYVDATIERGACFLRKPGVKKEPGDVGS